MKKVLFFLFLFFLALRIMADDELDELLKKYGDNIEKNENKIKKIISFDGSYDILTYSAKSGKVERIDSYYKSGNLIESTVFYRDSNTGEVLCIQRGGEFVYFLNIDKEHRTYISENAEKYNKYDTFFSSMTVKDDKDNKNTFEYNDEGNLVIKNINGEYEYNKDGKIVRDNDYLYFYNEDGEIDNIIKNDDKDVIIEKHLYKDNKCYESEFYDKGVLKRKLYILSDGNEEEYYENGEVYARAKYFDDNKRIKSINYI